MLDGIGAQRAFDMRRPAKYLFGGRRSWKVNRELGKTFRKTIQMRLLGEKAILGTSHTLSSRQDLM